MLAVKQLHRNYESNAQKVKDAMAPIINAFKVCGPLSLTFSFVVSLAIAKKFYIRGNNNKVDSIETERIVIAHLLP